jgi:GntR family transcriptional regulator
VARGPGVAVLQARAYSPPGIPHALAELMASASVAPARYQPGAPLYREVRARIAEAIRSGEWRPGEAIPPEKMLCERFGVSMGTLRKAVDELTVSGLLVRQQGRGTFVARHSEDRYLFSFFHLVGRDRRKEYPDVRFLSFGTAVADDFAGQVLGVKAGAPLLKISNLLSLGGVAVSLDEIYLPTELFPGLTEQRLRDRQTTLYQMYQDEFDITVVRASERVRGVAATRSQARLLKTEPGAPLLQIIRSVYSFEDRPVELRYSYVNTETCEYRPDPYVPHRA